MTEQETEESMPLYNSAVSVSNSDAAAEVSGEEKTENGDSVDMSAESSEEKKTESDVSEDSVSDGNTTETETADKKTDVTDGSPVVGKEEELQQEESEEELITEEVDLSEWIIQAGGLSVFPDEPIALYSEGEPQAQATDAQRTAAKQAILNAMKNRQSPVDMIGYNIPQGDAYKLFSDVLNDNPNLFYVKKSCEWSYYSNGMLVSISITYNTQYGDAQIQEYNAALEKAYAEAIPNPAGMTKAQKARALHDYLVLHMAYDEDSFEKSKTDKDYDVGQYNAYNALVKGTAVCEGYTLAYAALLKKADIEVGYCRSTALNHIWNYVKVDDNNWYHVDTTWDDPLFATGDKFGYVSYRYFLCSDEQMKVRGTTQTHYTWDANSTICNSTAFDNAYWKDERNERSAIIYYNGKDYYLQGLTTSFGFSLICRDGDTETLICNITDRWSSSSGINYLNYSSNLSYGKDMLIFNGPKNIYAWKPGYSGPRTIYTYTGADAIYSSLVCGDDLTIGTGPNPVAVTKQSAISLSGLLSLKRAVIANKTSDGYSTSYTYSGKNNKIAEPTAEQFTVTSAAGQVTGQTLSFEWYKDGTKLSNAPANAGNYTLRVTAAATDNYEEAVLNLPVTVAKKALTATVTAANKTYDGTTAAAVTATLANVVGGDTVTAQATGTFANKNAENNKKVNITNISLTGADAANYYIQNTPSVTANITKKPITVKADSKSIPYGDPEPTLTWAVDSSTPLVAGDNLSVSLTRQTGSNVGSYTINLTATNLNYEITTQTGTLTITQRTYDAFVAPNQTILQGVGKFMEPEFKYNKNGTTTPVSGTITYTYGGITNGSYAQMVDKLKTLALNTEGTISYTFTASSSNYTETKTGSISFTVKDIEFFVGGQAANGSNAVTLKTNPVYGDSWQSIVTKINTITAKAGDKTDSTASHFTLQETGAPNAGTQTYTILYNGTLNGKTYTNQTVCSGTVMVGQRPIQVLAGSCKMGKSYDKTISAGTISGSLTMTGLLGTDSGKLQAAQTGQLPTYTKADVHTGTVTISVALSGDAAGNYKLANTTVSIPCEITSSTVTPEVSVVGPNTYTGSAIKPAVTVTVGGETLTAADYTVVYSNNINAGTGKATVSAVTGRNYTWTPFEATFTIERAEQTNFRFADTAQSKVYGDAEFAVTASGEAAGSTVTYTSSDTSVATVDNSGKVKILSAGSATITANASATNNYNTATASYTLTVGKKTIKVAAGSYHMSKEYDKTTDNGTASGNLSISGVLSGDKEQVSVDSIWPATVYGNRKDVGENFADVTLGLSGEKSSNYTLGTASVKVPCRITAKTITPVVTVADPGSYTGTPLTPAVTVKTAADGETISNTDYTVEYIDNLNAGTATVRVRAKSGKNYTWTDAAGVTFTIAKADYSGAKTKSVSAKYGNTASCDVSAFLPAEYRFGTVSIADANSIFDGRPELSGKTLTYKLKDVSANKDKTATVTIPVTGMKNYNDYSITVTVKVSEKLSQTTFRFETSAQTKVYGSGTFTIAASGAAAGSRVEYTSSNLSVATVDASGKVTILAAGSTVIQATASETNEYVAAEYSYTLTVAQKELSWDIGGIEAADNTNTASSNNLTASLYGELRFSGVEETDKNDVTFNCPAALLKGTYDSAASGNKKVPLDWKSSDMKATLQGGKSGNYKLPLSLPEIEGKINEVKDLPPITVSGGDPDTDYKLKMETGVSKSLLKLAQMEELNTPSKILNKMKENLQTELRVSLSTGNTQVYDVDLMIKGKTAADTSWSVAGLDKFPVEGVKVTIPYPAGTGKSTHIFYVGHLFTETTNGKNAGTIEIPQDVDRTDDGISFTVYGLSPIAISWIKIETPASSSNQGSASQPAEIKKPAEPEKPAEPQNPSEPEKPAEPKKKPVGKKKPTEVVQAPKTETPVKATEPGQTEKQKETEPQKNEEDLKNTAESGGTDSAGTTGDSGDSETAVLQSGGLSGAFVWIILLIVAAGIGVAVYIWKSKKTGN